MDRASRIAASKKLSRYKLHLQNVLFWGNVIWCRTAYSEKEGTTIGTPNQHTFYELHYVLDGELEVSIDGNAPFSAGKGYFILIPPRCTHCIRPMGEDLEKFVCGLTIDSEMDFVRQALELLDPMKIYRATEAMPVYVDWMLENAMTSRAGTTTAINNLLECLILEVLRQVSPDSLEKTEDRKVFENDIRIREIQEYIEQNIDGRLTGENVARRMNISLRHLNRLTDKYLGCSVGQLIARQRIVYIKELLYSHELTLRDIAERTGFQSEYALNRFFKQQEGMSIGVYRRSLES
ncbi:MAG: helix-turn-helix transcriptional regulator [Clostridia bacterium]|nr:helix-turn-helix transcriptional regulator [Clostridia bacterium]